MPNNNEIFFPKYCRHIASAGVLALGILALKPLPLRTSIPNHSTIMQAPAQFITAEVANQHLVNALAQLEITVGQALPLQNSPGDEFALETRINIAEEIGYSLVSLCRPFIRPL
jgi:hypothetical protein